MEIIKVIKLKDGTIHQSSELADRHLTNKIYRCTIIHSLADAKIATVLGSILYSQSEEVNELMNLIQELKEVHKISIRNK